MSVTKVGQARWVGRAIPRREDPKLLTGKGNYIGDMSLPGMAYVHIVRSTEAHARIRQIDVDKALRLPGTVAVILGPEMAERMEPLLVPSIIPNLGGELQVPHIYPLAIDEVHYVGEPVAAVVAESKYEAEDAAEQIEITYEPLPRVLDPEEALAPEAPKVYRDWKNNVLWHGVIGGGDRDAAFSRADYVFRERFYGHRTGTLPMETRGVVASYDPFSGLTVYGNTQRPHILRMGLAEILRLPHDKVRAIAPREVGGAFGTKAPLYREEVLVSYLAMRLGRPVKWIETRLESLMVTGQERDQIHELEVAVRADGRILGIRDRMVADVGAGDIGVYLGFVMAWCGGAYLTNAYDIPYAEIDLTCVATHKPSLTPSRAFGEFPARFAMDYAMHLIARDLGLDPRQVYERNLICNFPFVSPTGITHDSGDYGGAFRRLIEAIDYDAIKEEQKRARAEGRYIGVGFSVGAEVSGFSSQLFVPLENQPGYGAATVKIDAHGMVHVCEGDSPQGQGHETTLSQVVADELGVEPSDVYLSYGDSLTTPFASGTLGNRGASYTFSAAVLACRRLRPKIYRIAAHLMGMDEAAEEEFSLENRHVVWRRDPNRRIPLKEVASAAILGPTRLPPGVEPGLEASAYFEPTIAGMWSIGVHGVVVEVERETGAYRILRYVVVDDSGCPINPLVVRGQIHGGVVMGIGNTRYEAFRFDAEGRPLATTLMEYTMPSAADVPEIEVIEHNVPTPYTPLGSKGKGEGVPGPVPAAIASAITDAVGNPRFRLCQLPLTPEAVWRAWQKAEAESTRLAGA